MTTKQDDIRTALTPEDSTADVRLPSLTDAGALKDSTEFFDANTEATSRSTTESLDGLMTSDKDLLIPTAMRRKFRPMRFAVGLTLTTISVSLILWIAIRMLDVHHLGGRFALALVAVVVMSSVMMLGAGFALMATAAADFDDSEFERLIRSGNISSADALMTESSSGSSDTSTIHSSAA